MKSKALIIVSILVMALMSVPAMADFSYGTFYISVGNADISLYPPPYLKVDVTGSGAVANFDVTSLTSGNLLYLFGGNDVFGANFNIPNGDKIVLSSFVGTPWDNACLPSPQTLLIPMRSVL